MKSVLSYKRGYCFPPHFDVRTQSLCDDSGIDLFWNVYKVHHAGNKEEYKVQESRERRELHDLIIVLGLNFCSTMWWVEAGGSKVSGNVCMLGLYEMQEACGTPTNRTKKERSGGWVPQHNSEATIAKAVPEKWVWTMKTPLLQHQEGSTGSLVTLPWILLESLYHH